MTTLSLIINRVLNLNNNIFFKNYKSDNIDISFKLLFNSIIKTPITTKAKFIFFEHHYDNMLIKNYTFLNINELLKKNNFIKIYKSKMPFRKTFEYIYVNQSKI